MKNMKDMVNTNKTRRSHLWMWFVIVFVFGVCIGYVTHYVIVNWNKLFVVCPNENKPEMCCPNGNRPDENGCCDGEVYTDAGSGWMVCCPEGDDSCFPPIKW